MARNISKQLRNSKHPIIDVANNMGGCIDSGTKYGLPKNAYIDCKNIILSERGGFKKRRTASQLGVEPDGDLSRVYGIGYQKDFGWIRVKGSNIQTLSSPTATWTTIASGYTVLGSNFVDFVEFKATSTSSGTTKTLSEDSSERYLQVNETMTPNEHIGKLLKIGSEVKLIIGNTDTVIYIQEKFEGDYIASTSLEIVEQVTAVYIVSPGKNMRIWRGGSSLETTSYTYDRAVLQSNGGLKNNGRLFCLDSSASKIHVSEVGTGEYFQKDSFIPMNLSGELLGLSEIGDRIVVYSKYGRTSIVGDNPDNFQVVPTVSNKGALSAGSIASGNNIEYYLSHEGIEFLNSIENATVTEGMSLSDRIKKKFERHTNFDRAHATISNGKYYLSIEDWVYIYDLEASVKFHKPIFTFAQYSECSQTVVSNAVAGEWTHSLDVDGQLTFAQGGLVYRVTDEKIGANDTQAQLEYMIEFPIEMYGDKRLNKAIQKYRLYLQNDKTLTNARTRIRIYFSKNEEDYELVRDVENDFEIQTFLSAKAKTTSFKIVLEDLDTEVDDPEFSYSELEFYYLTKR